MHRMHRVGVTVKEEEIADDISELQFGVENEKISDSDMELITSTTNTKTYGCPIVKPWAAETHQSRKLRMYADPGSTHQAVVGPSSTPLHWRPVRRRCRDSPTWSGFCVRLIGQAGCCSVQVAPYHDEKE